MVERNEAPEVKVGDFSIFPYSTREQADAAIKNAQTHFEIGFHVRQIGEGYILMSDDNRDHGDANKVLDSRGYCVSDISPLNGAPQAARKIRDLSRKVD